MLILILSAARKEIILEEAALNVVEFSDVDKWFGDFQALKKINLTIKQGEIVVICGPSGSGKSTLIRCINGLESYDAGKLTVFEQLELNQQKGKVGMVFQHFYLFPHLTILENLTLAPMRTLHLSKQAATERAMHFLKRVKIENPSG